MQFIHCDVRKAKSNRHAFTHRNQTVANPLTLSDKFSTCGIEKEAPTCIQARTHMCTPSSYVRTCLLPWHGGRHHLR